VNARVTSRCHSRRAARRAAREGNPFGNDCARFFDKWIPFPSHDDRHARPGMTEVVFEGEAMNGAGAAPSVRLSADALRWTPPPQAGEETRDDAFPFLPRLRGRCRALRSGRDGGGAR
jgi:hypothetical protein